MDQRKRPNANGSETDAQRLERLERDLEIRSAREDEREKVNTKHIRIAAAVWTAIAFILGLVWSIISKVLDHFWK